MDVEGMFSLLGEFMDKNALNFECIYYHLPPKFSKDTGNSVLYSAMWTLDAYYEMMKIPVKVGFQNNVAIREMIKNSRWHGGSKDEFLTYLGLFLNKDKFSVGCNDGGDYFKREDIKKTWENKRELNEFHEANQYGIGYHYGYSYFKSKFDEIKIDEKNGTLYGIVNVRKYLKNVSEKQN